MTLNITFVAAGAIYQSSDYRLSDPNTGRRIEVRGHKVADVVGLPGIICFTGVATTPKGEFVGDWLARQVPFIRVSVSLGEVIDALKGADDWLRHYERSSRLISFTLATWHEDRPLVALISNFEDLTGRRHEVSLRLEVSVARPRPPWFLVTGRRDGMRGPDRRRLEHLASAPQSRVLELMAETNRHVSARVGDDIVSPSCRVGLIERNGRMAGRPFDTEPFDNIPPQLAAALQDVLTRTSRTMGPDGQPEPLRIVQWASGFSKPESKPPS